MTHRFFVEQDILEEVALRGEQAHQIANVLRLKAGDQIKLVRNGTEALVVLVPPGSLAMLLSVSPGARSVAKLS